MLEAELDRYKTDFHLNPLKYQYRGGVAGIYFAANDLVLERVHGGFEVEISSGKGWGGGKARGASQARLFPRIMLKAGGVGPMGLESGLVMSTRALDVELVSEVSGVPSISPLHELFLTFEVKLDVEVRYEWDSSKKNHKYKQKEKAKEEAKGLRTTPRGEWKVLKTTAQIVSVDAAKGTGLHPSILKWLVNMFLPRILKNALVAILPPELGEFLLSTRGDRVATHARVAGQVRWLGVLHTQRPSHRLLSFFLLISLYPPPPHPTPHNAHCTARRERPRLFHVSRQYGGCRFLCSRGAES